MFVVLVLSVFIVCNVQAGERLVSVFELQDGPIVIEVGDAVIVFSRTNISVPNIGGGSVTSIQSMVFTNEEFQELGYLVSYSFQDYPLIQVDHVGQLMATLDVEYYGVYNSRIFSGTMDSGRSFSPPSPITLFIAGDKAQIVWSNPEGFCISYEYLSREVSFDPRIDEYIIELNWVDGRIVSAMNWIDIEGRNVLLINEPEQNCGLLTYDYQLGEAILRYNLDMSGKWNFTNSMVSTYYWQALLQEIFSSPDNN
jgi:hypothetical protein